jgi:hypothetical protein
MVNRLGTGLQRAKQATILGRSLPPIHFSQSKVQEAEGSPFPASNISLNEPVCRSLFPQFSANRQVLGGYPSVGFLELAVCFCAEDQKRAEGNSGRQP